MLRAIVILVALIGLSTCDRASGADTEAEAEAIAKARALVVRKLPNPASAQFRDVFVGKNTSGQGGPETMVCGQVGVKNGEGGDAGFRRFVAMFEGTDALVEPVAPTEEQYFAMDKRCDTAGGAACARANEMREAILHRAGFEGLWKAYCSKPPS